MNTLVISASEEVLGVSSFQKAIKHVFLGNAVVRENYDQTISSPSVTMNIPAVIQRKEYKSVPYEPLTKVSCSPRGVLRRDSYTCQYCESKLNKSVKIEEVTRKPSLIKVYATVDHVIPQAAGGRNSWHNLVACCGLCNRIKADKSLKNSGLKLIREPHEPRGFMEVVRVRFGQISDLWVDYLYDF